MRRHAYSSLMMGALTMIVSSSVDATVMEALSTRQLVFDATDVVEGVVTSQRVVTMRGRLWTDTRVKIERSFKGGQRTGRSVSVRQLGGETKKLGLRVAGTARFVVGEKVLLFLRPVQRYFVPVGMCQGKYEIYADGDGIVRARRDLSGASFARFNRAGTVVLTPSVTVVGAGDQPLVDLYQIIKAASRAGGER